MFKTFLFIVVFAGSSNIYLTQFLECFFVAPFSWNVFFYNNSVYFSLNLSNSIQMEIIFHYCHHCPPPHPIFGIMDNIFESEYLKARYKVGRSHRERVRRFWSLEIIMDF